MTTVWFDALTPKHLRMARHVRMIAEKKGYNFLLTTRDYDEIPTFSKLLDLQPIVVGKHGGEDPRDKLLRGAERLNELVHLLGDKELNFVISHGSPEATRIGFGIGTPTINVNDSPHAEAVARLTVPLTTRLVSSSFIPRNAWTRFGLHPKALVQYRGLEVVTWLKEEKVRPKDFGLKRPIVLFRPEEIKASYMVGAKQRSTYLLHELKRALRAGQFSLVVLPRYDSQRRAFREELPDAFVLDKPEDGLSLIKGSDVFVGGGGTMTWEAALLGVPTLYAFPKKIYIERALEGFGLLTRVGPHDFISRLRSVIGELPNVKRHQVAIASRVLKRLEDPMPLLEALIDPSRYV
jgi:predicted glycosyltransferase